MDQDELYAERMQDKYGKSKTMDEYHDIAYGQLCEHIHDDMPDNEVRDHLERIAEIYQLSCDMKEKYALISDIFDAIVTTNSEKMVGHD